jgi:hypothetical protein
MEALMGTILSGSVRVLIHILGKTFFSSKEGALLVVVCVLYVALIFILRSRLKKRDVSLQPPMNSGDE